MMCRLFQGIPRALRHKAQANTTHPAWTGNSSQKRRHKEETTSNGLNAAPLSSDALHPSDKRSTQPLPSGTDFNSLVRHMHLKLEDGWRSFAGSRQWDSFKEKGNSYTSHDAVEWGTALVFSLHLCRVLAASTLPDDSSGGKKKILASVADRLPGLWSKPVSLLSLLHQEEGKRTEPKPQETKPEIPDPIPATPLAAAVAGLQAVTNQSLGQAHNSLGVKKAQKGQLEEAVGHFSEGSKVGFSKATFNLAVCHEQGRGVTQDLEKAADLYKVAAAQGHPQASYNLGVFHLMGKGGLQQDMARALELMGTAAVAGVTQANRYLGIHFLEDKEQRDEGKAATFLQKAAEKQDVEAEYYLGLCYEHGWGVPSNGAKAVSLYHKAAMKDHPEALCSLARCHELGLGGLPINKKSALQFYKQASEVGHEQASESLEQLLSNPTADTSKVPQVSTRAAHNTGVIPTRESNSSNISQSRIHGLQEVNKSLHVSVSAPSLSNSEGKTLQSEPGKGSAQHKFSYKSGKASVSQLSLLLPYYFSLPSRPPIASLGMTNGAQSSKVSFQVGDEESSDEEDRADSSAHGFESRFFTSNPCLMVT
ncbi:death ligand signal enhancer-like [Acanthaster planci]|uniref:Death ligand signal enhancer-like n=1 Tax=Acanthaster planci TaxID=133434 RepID=A0A8B7XWT2_ACAPL|nr:death ligand signal enhancer-like [Acanthaster planci]